MSTNDKIYNYLRGIGLTGSINDMLYKWYSLIGVDEWQYYYLTRTYLFGLGQQGVWYDPSNLSTLFQDSAGTVPVTAMEQPVGRMLDLSWNGNHAFQATSTKRGVVSRRVNLLTKTEQFDASDWIKAALPGAGTASAPVVIANDDGQADKVTFDATGAGRSILNRTFTYQPGNYAGSIRLKAATPADVGKIIAFRHASGGAYLLITLTADYQVVGTDESSPSTYTGAFELAIRPEVGTSAGAVSVHIAYVSLTLTIDAHLPYQRVNTATDYDADPSKFPTYIRFDGVDDAYQTNSIDFTGTDKMTVWAGVTKLSITSIQAIAELSSTFANNSTFLLYAYDSAATIKYEFGSRGTSVALATTTDSAYHAPTSNVVTGIGHILGDMCSLRVDGLQVGQSTADQGTVNYGNYPLYIGARAATSSLFNGRLYSLIVAGDNYPLSQTESVEYYMKRKMILP